MTYLHASANVWGAQVRDGVAGDGGPGRVARQGMIHAGRLGGHSRCPRQMGAKIDREYKFQEIGRGGP